MKKQEFNPRTSSIPLYLCMIATGLMITIGSGGIGAIAPTAFALSSHTSTNINAPVSQSNQQVANPKTTATITTTQINSPHSSINAGSGKNSFGVGVANQNNDQSSNSVVNQNTNIDQNANNLNVQGFNIDTTTTLFCIFNNEGDC